jgi:endonuclease/exonuclease/phosphatase family metal-dependent hydrolase
MTPNTSVSRGAHRSLFGALACSALVLGLLPALAAADAAPDGNDAHRYFTVMTRNMDEGTDFKLIFGASTPSQFAAAAAATYQEVVASKIPERAAAIAGEIMQTRPDVVSLQEVSLWRTGTLLQPPAQNVTFDQLASLEESLTADGVAYMPVIVLNEIDAEAPTTLGFDVRVTDRDVILVRADAPPGQLTIDNPRSAHFSTLLTIPSAIGPITVPRGWASVDATLRGRTVRVIATHLESFSSAVQSAQANEIATGPAGTDLPVILAGDLNTGPGGSPAYGQLLADGFIDTWDATHPSDPGFTNPLFTEDPFVPFATPNQRIDLVLVRGAAEPSADLLTGNDISDLTPSGRWPSDHAGVVATVRIPS